MPGLKQRRKPHASLLSRLPNKPQWRLKMPGLKQRRRPHGWPLRRFASLKSSKFTGTCWPLKKRLLESLRSSSQPALPLNRRPLSRPNKPASPLNRRPLSKQNMPVSPPKKKKKPKESLRRIDLPRKLRRQNSHASPLKRRPHN